MSPRNAAFSFSVCDSWLDDGVISVSSESAEFGRVDSENLDDAILMKGLDSVRVFLFLFMSFEVELFVLLASGALMRRNCLKVAVNSGAWSLTFIVCFEFANSVTS